MDSRNKMGLRKRSGLGLGSGVVRYTRSMSGKRVAILGNTEYDYHMESEKLLKEKSNTIRSRVLQLESLPEDVLVSILCGVDHDDLKQLFHVSTVIRDATIIAKNWHFEFSTPTKKRFSVRKLVDVGPSEDEQEIEAPDAPKQSRIPKSRLCKEKLANISVALFASLDDEK